jgi:antitoxin YefM
MKTYTVTKARSEIFKIMEQVVVYNEPVQITTSKGNAVVLSEDDYRAIEETLHLLSVPGMRESILDAVRTPDSEWRSEDDLPWNTDCDSQHKR